MGKGGYGTIAFWTEWYSEAEHIEPYDWLVTWEDVGPAIEALLDYNHDARILVVGCGNSAFSSELFARGYRNLTNVDNCPSIIATQRERFPMLTWLVGDVRCLDLEGGWDAVLDKGCLDNLYCYVDAAKAVADFKEEVRRLLKPRGRLIVISCHNAQTTQESLQGDWGFAQVAIPNPRWPRIKIETLQFAVVENHSSNVERVLRDAIARLAHVQTSTTSPARLAHLEHRSSGLRHSQLLSS